MSKVESGERCYRPTRAEVDLPAIAHNFQVIRSVTKSRVFAVVKADAYGHGAIRVARTLEAAGVDGFCVALAEEGVELRQAGVSADILVMNGVYGNAHRDVLAHGLTPVVYDVADARAFRAAALDKPPSVHVKVDTGMSRLGIPLSRLPEFLDALEGVQVDGLMTHLASAEGDDAFTDQQLARFAEAEALIRQRGFSPSLRHAANTAATFRRPDTHFDLVRTGLALYGYTGIPDLQVRLRPAMCLRSEIISVREVPAGGVVGYGTTYHADRLRCIATVPLGYADGLMFALSNRGCALVRGHRCPIVGRVSMDLTGIDVTAVEGAVRGEEVVLLGADRFGVCLGADEVAVAASTIPYEVLTSVSRRVPRVYPESSVPF